MRISSNNPILKSELNSTISDSKKQNQSSSKHTTPVWNVLWERPSTSTSSPFLSSNNNNNDDGDQQQQDQKDTDNDNTNNDLQHQRHKLYSISSDGIIKQWSMKKGFNSTNIMSLKRVPNLSAKRGSVIDNTIRSRQGSGLCFDFPLNLKNNNLAMINEPSSSSTTTKANNDQYYVGTEDGIIHKCSISYNEQVLRTYYGHTGPIYKIQCSPFDYNKFITCSSDWTINIWSEHKSIQN